MRVVSKLLMLTCVLGMGVLMYSSTKHKPEADLDTIYSKISNELLELGLKEVECPKIFRDDPYKYRKCLAAPLKAEDFIAQVDEKILGRFTRTLGWRQDYGVWVAMYRLSASPEIAFGISVQMAENDRELTALMPDKQFNTFVGVTFERLRQ